MSDLTGLATSNGETTSQVTGTPYLYHSSCLSRAPPLPPLAKREKPGFRTFSSLRSSTTPLSPRAQEELVWWRDNLEAWNGRTLVSGSPDLVIKTDASWQGWGGGGGTFCNGVSTGGQWSQGESLFHTNCLELLAGAFAVKTFVKGKVQMRVRLLMDNLTATHYINKMGGTKSPVLARLALDLWEWCLHHNILIEAQYLPGVLNIRADRESRVF